MSLSCCVLQMYRVEREDSWTGLSASGTVCIRDRASKDIVPKPFDGEVEEFTLKTIEEVQIALGHGEFKLNCAMTWMAYLIRHGIVNAENEDRLFEINARLHRKHDIFVVD